MLGRSTWVVVVIGSEWEVPPQLLALRGSMRKSTSAEKTHNGRDVFLSCRWMEKVVKMVKLDKSGNWAANRQSREAEMNGANP